MCFQQWIERAPDQHLHLPTPNVFIPTDLALKKAQEKVFSFHFAITVL